MQAPASCSTGKIGGSNLVEVTKYMEVVWRSLKFFITRLQCRQPLFPSHGTMRNSKLHLRTALYIQEAIVHDSRDSVLVKFQSLFISRTVVPDCKITFHSQNKRPRRENILYALYFFVRRHLGEQFPLIGLIFQVLCLFPDKL